MDDSWNQLSAGGVRRAEKACDRFEHAWRRGLRPSPQEFLHGLGPKERRIVLKQLVLLDADYRASNGEAVDDVSYSQRFPELSRSWIGRHLSPQAISDGAGRPSAGKGIGPTDGLGPFVAPKVIGDYEVCEEIARGGMGIVYRAKHKRLNRYVALKLMLVDPASCMDEQQRFRLEAEATASLDHPNIVPIYEVGEHRSAGGAATVPYLSMKLIQGESLASAISKKHVGATTPQEVRRSAQLLATIARAVHHAHQHGILHRDIKPANILLDSQGRAFITDFGLAKRLEKPLDDDALRDDPTGSNILVGTPSYIAPEQMVVGSKGLTTSADVYSLGAILYELLAGRPPFTGDTVLETLKLTTDDEPSPPSKLRTGVPRDLETIALKCLQKKPSDRYTSAEGLAEDLERFLSGEPVRARRMSWPLRLVKWSRRRPALAGLLAALAFTLATGFAAVTWQWRAAYLMQLQIQEEQERTEDALKHAEQQRISVERLLDKQSALSLIGRVARTQRHLANNDVGEALEESVLCPADQKCFEHYYLRGLCDRRMKILYRHEGPVNCISLSRVSRRTATGGEDGMVVIWDLGSGEHRRLEFGVPIRSVAIGKAGNLLAVAGDGVSLIEANTGKLLTHFPDAPDAPTLCLSFGNRGHRLAAGSASSNQNVRVWDVGTRELMTSFLANQGAVSSIDFHPNPVKLATGGSDGSAILWDIEKNTPLLNSVLREPISSVFCTGGGRGFYAISAGDTPTLRVWNIQGRSLRRTQLVSSWPIESGATIGNYRVAVADSGGAIKLFNTQNFTREFDFRGHKGPVLGVDGASDEGLLVSCGADGTVRQWSLEQNLGARKLSRPGERVSTVSVAPSGRHALVATPDEIKWIETGTGRVAQRLECKAARCHTYAPTEGVVAYARDDETNSERIYLQSLTEPPSDNITTDASPWDGKAALPAAPRNEVKLNFAQGRASGPAKAIAIETGGNWVAAACASHHDSVGSRGALQVFNRDTRKLYLSIPTSIQNPTCLGFSRDGRWLAMGGKEGLLQVWETTNWSSRHELREAKTVASIQALAFHPTEPLLAIAGEDGLVRLWDIDEGAKAIEFQPHKSPITSLCFSQDGRRLFGGALDGAVRLWDTRTGLSVMLLETDTQAVASVALSASGDTLVAGYESGVLKAWDAPKIDKDL